MERAEFQRVQQAGHMLQTARMLETMPFPQLLTEPERQAMLLVQQQLRAIARRLYQAEQRFRKTAERER